MSGERTITREETIEGGRYRFFVSNVAEGYIDVVQSETAGIWSVYRGNRQAHTVQAGYSPRSIVENLIPIL